MVGNLTIQGQITGTATFDGAKISAVVTVAPPINATVVFGKSGVTVHNELTGRDAADVHPKESIIGLKLADSPEFANTQITTLDSVATGGVIPAAEATWLGATAKSVLSYLQKLVSKVYAINSRVAMLENRIVADITTTTLLTSVDITGLNFVDGDVFSVESYGSSSVESGAQSLVLNVKNGLEYWYNGSTIMNGFIGLTGGYYHNLWTVRVAAFNCFCATDHHRSNAAGNSFTTVRVCMQSKATAAGGVISPPITSLKITGNANAIAIGTRIIVKKI